MIPDLVNHHSTNYIIYKPTQYKKTAVKFEYR